MAGNIFGGTATVIAATAVQLPYLILASVMIVPAIVFRRIKLPVITAVENAEAAEKTKDSIFKHSPLLFGTLLKHDNSKYSDQKSAAGA